VALPPSMMDVGAGKYRCAALMRGKSDALLPWWIRVGNGRVKLNLIRCCYRIEPGGLSPPRAFR